MKRIILFTFIFFVTSPAFADNYTLDAPPVSSNGGYNSAQIPTTAQKKKKGFLNRLFYPKQKQRPEFDEDSKGYEGTLPNIESEFKYKIPKKATVEDKGDTADDFTPEEFQKSRTDDPLFLDVILNKEKPSQYNIDMVKIVEFLERFRPVVENHENIQKFNANVNLLDLHARRMQTLYANKPEGMSPSYFKLQDLAYKAKILGNLKFDANYYSQFSPVTGTKYAPDNIINEDNKFLIELDKTVFEIKQLSN